MDLGKVIAEQTQRIQLTQAEAWERVLRLHVRPRPKWLPESLWIKILGLVLMQSEQK